MPALHLDAALVHASRADARGNAQFLGPGPVLRRPVLHGRASGPTCPASGSCRRAELTAAAPVQTLRIQRWMVTGVVEAPHGAHFTLARPTTAATRSSSASTPPRPPIRPRGRRSAPRYLGQDEAGYQAAVAARRDASAGARHDRRRDAGPRSASWPAPRRGAVTGRSWPARSGSSRLSVPGWPGPPSSPTCCSPTARRCWAGHLGDRRQPDGDRGLDAVPRDLRPDL